MANLPENQTYIKSNNVPIPKVPNVQKAVTSAPKPKPTGPGSFTDLMSRMDQMETMGRQAPSAPAAPAFDAMNFTMRPSMAPPTIPTGELLSQSPSLSQPLGTSGYEATWEGVTPSEQAQLRTFGGTGQYVSDPLNKDKIIRSARLSEDDYTWQTLKKAALEGRSSRLYQVDHAIPLWLGGTNTAENLQVLSRPKHAQKTKAESVALTLYANKIIDRDEAFYLATTWENRDMSIVPAPERNPEYTEGQTTGQLPLAKAIEIRNAWKTAETAKPKIKFSDFWGAVKSNPILYGFSKGLTAGAVKDNPDVPTGALNTTLSTGANIAGTLLTVSALGKLFGLAGTSVKALGATKSVLDKAGIVKQTVDTGRKVSTFTPNATVTMKDALKVAQGANFRKWTAPVMAYGQIQETFEEDPARLTRAMEDFVYGGLTGYFAPNLKGAAKTATTVFALSMMADTFNGRTENLTQNALINALTIGGLHGISAPGVRKQAEEIIRNESSRTAHNVLSLYMPKVTAVDSAAPVPTYTLQQIDELEGELAASLSKRLAGESDNGLPPLSEDEFMQQAQVIDAAFDTLRVTTLKGEAADTFAAQKLQQFIKTVNNKSDREQFFGGVIPTSRVTRIVDSMPQDLVDAAPAYAPDPARLSGVMRTTGLAKNYHPDPQGLAEFIAQPQNNYKTVIAIRRPEREGLNKFLSDSDANDWTDANPANTIQLVGVTKTQDGIKYTNLGYVPQENRIASTAKGGRPNSINDQPEIKQGKFPEYDVNFNKDNLSMEMDKEGLDYLFVTLKNYGYEGSASGKPNLDFPFVEFSVGRDNWARSIEAQKGAGRLKPSVAEDGAASVLARANTTTNKEVRQEAVEEFVQNQSLPASAALQLDNPVVQSFDSGGITQLKSHLTMAEDALSEPDAAGVATKMKQYFDVDLDESEALELFSKRETVTVDDLFTTIDEKSSPIVKVIIGEMKPELDALKNSDEWELRQVFNQMRIVGKKEPEVTMPARENVTIGADAPSRESVTVGDAPTAPATQAAPETVVVEAAPASPAAQALVNKAAELGITPPTPAVKPVEAPIVTLDTKKHTPRIIEAASIVVPQGGVRTSRQQMIDEITDNTVREAEGILKNIRYGARIGAEGYKKQLLGVVENIEPVLSRNPKAPMKGDATTDGLNVPLSPVEKMAIRQDARDHLRNVALATYRDKVTLDNEMYFKLLGFKKGDDDYNLVKSMQEALDAEAFGFKREVQALRQEMGDEEFERVFRILNEKADDSVVKSIGKAPEEAPVDGKKNLGIKDGLLKDTMASFKTADGKTVTYDAEKVEIRRQSGKQVIEDFVGKPQKNAKPGTYMRTFADAIDEGLSKTKLGKAWKTNPAALDLFATVNNKRFVDLWDDLLKRSDGEATQPLDYLRALGTGQRGKAQKIASDRQELQYKVKDEVMDRQSKIRTDESGSPEEGVLEPGMRTREVTQLDDEQIPAPALMDRVMAGFTTAVNEGYTPTPEQALNDALQFLFFANRVSPFGFNASIADDVTKTVVESLSKQGVRITNVKDPLKKAGAAYADATSVKKEADALLKDELGPRFKALLSAGNPGKTPYTSFRGVAGKTNTVEGITALGEAMKKRLADYEIGKWKTKMTPEEMLFIDSYNKYQNLMLQVKESDRRKSIMKADSNVMKATKKDDGQGYPGPMDGQGGMIGNAWGKLKDMMSNTVTYERPKEPTPTAADMPLLKPESPHLLGKTAKAQLPGEWIGTNYDPEVRHQNRPDATSTNLGLGAAGLRIQPGMAAVPRKPGSEEAMLRLGTVIENPETGERYLIADLMNRRFDGMQKVDFATKGTGDTPHPDYNKIFKGWRIIREGSGREDARRLVESGEWDKIKNGKK